jgi:hypothetical protein
MPRVGLAIGLLLAAAWFVWQVLGVVESPDFSDFHTVYIAAQAIAHGHDPYSVTGLLQTPFASHYKYPPFLATAMSSLLVFSDTRLEWAFVCLSLFLYLVTFLLLLRIMDAPLWSGTSGILAIAFLVWQPSIDTLSGAQQEFVLLFLFTLACWALARSRRLEGIAGGAIAVCTIIKVYPALIIVYFLMRRWWKALVVFAAMILLMTLFSVARSGLALQIEFWLRIFPILKGGNATDENQSLMGFFDRFYVDGVTVDESLLTNIPTANLLYHIGCLVLFIISFGCLIRSRSAQDAFKILIPAMLLMAPASWIHYEELMLLPFGLLLADYREDFSFRKSLPLIICFCLIAFGNEVTVMNVPWRVLNSYKVFGLVMFWILGLLSTQIAFTGSRRRLAG